jgi:hypothetical protein
MDVMPAQLQWRIKPVSLIEQDALGAANVAMSALPVQERKLALW